MGRGAGGQVGSGAEGRLQLLEGGLPLFLIHFLSLALLFFLLDLGLELAAQRQSLNLGTHEGGGSGHQLISAMDRLSFILAVCGDFLWMGIKLMVLKTLFKRSEVCRLFFHDLKQMSLLMPANNVLL